MSSTLSPASRNAPVPMTRAQLVALGAVIATDAAVGAGLSLGLPLLSLVAEARGVSSTLIGLNNAVAGIAILLVGAWVTPLARRFGAVPVLISAILVAATSFLLFHVAQAFWLWFPLRLVFHGALAFMFILSEFWINTLAPPDRRGLVMGIYATVLSLGFAIGPLILGLAGSTGLLPFALGSGILLAAAVPVVFALGQSPELHEKPSAGMLGYILLVPLATFGVLAFGAVESGGMAFLALYGIGLGLPEANAAFLVSMVAFGNVVLQIPLGLLADRVDRTLLLGLCALVGLAGALAMPYAASHEPLLWALLFVWGGSIAGLYTVGLVHLGARFSGTDLAAANAAFVMMYAVGMLIGLPGIGLAMDMWVPHGISYAIAGLCAAYLALVVVEVARGRA